MFKIIKVHVLYHPVNTELRKCMHELYMVKTQVVYGKELKEKKKFKEYPNIRTAKVSRMTN